MAQFEADKVFQKRVLTIILAKVLSFSFGVSLDFSLKVICTLICMAILFGFRSLLQEITTWEVPITWAYILFIPVGWNYMIINSIYHSYDLPCLAIFCWGISLFLKKQFFLFYIIFFIGSFNRESTCFITISLFVVSLQLPDKITIHALWDKNRFIFTHSIYQFFLWWGAKGLLEFIFRNNPGSYYEETYSMINFIQDIWYGNSSWPFLDTSSFLGNPRSFLTLFACIWILIPLLWNKIPTRSKKLLWIVPPYLIAAGLYANLMESRVYQELNVILSLLVVSGLINIKKHSNRFANA